MKILWVKAGKLLPVDTGGKIRSFNILRRLAERHEVTLLSYYGGSRDEAYESELGRRLPGAVTVHGTPGSGMVRNGVDYLRRIPNAQPYAVTKFTSRKVQRTVSELLGSGRFDVAVCDFLAASLNFPAALDTPTVLFQHNVESVLWQRQARHEPDLFKRLAFKLEAAKMLRYERATVGRFHHVVAVSGNDRDLMSSMIDPGRVSVVPTGVDLHQYQAAGDDVQHSNAKGPLVIFVGSMDWEANIDAVAYFCFEIWPAVKKAVPRARLRIVGRNPNSRVKKLAGDSIEVTGTVASVVEHYREADVNIVPLRVGGGTRLKIYEAMAMGKPTVSSSIGAEGLDVNDGRDILIANAPQDFANSVIALLQDGGFRARIGQAAVQQAAKFDWPVIADKFLNVLERVAGAAAARPSVPAAMPSRSSSQLKDAASDFKGMLTAKGSK